MRRVICRLKDSNVKGLTYGTATSSHVHLSRTLVHDDAIVIGPVRAGGTVLTALDFNVSDVLSR
jgi:hypothetical protein